MLDMSRKRAANDGGNYGRLNGQNKTLASNLWSALLVYYRKVFAIDHNRY